MAGVRVRTPPSVIAIVPVLLKLKASPVRVVTSNGIAFALNAEAPLKTDVDRLFNWAESVYPHLFAPASRPTQISPPYSYRHYPDTGNYLGVAGNDVYVLGPISQGHTVP